MSDRQRDQQTVARVHVIHGDSGFRVVHVIVVRARDQLGHASRASRQLEDARFVGIDLDCVEESSIQRRIAAQQIPNGLGAQDRAHSGMGLPDPRGQLSRVEVTERLGDGVAGRSGELKEGVDLVPAVSCQGHDRDRAESLEREI